MRAYAGACVGHEALARSALTGLSAVTAAAAAVGADVSAETPTLALVTEQADRPPAVRSCLVGALAAENALARELPPVYGALLIHVASLTAEIDPTLDARVVGGYLLSAIAPPVLHRMHSRGVEISTLQRAAIQLIRGITGPTVPSSQRDRAPRPGSEGTSTH